MMLLEWPIGSAIVRLGIGADEPVGVVGVDPRDASCGAERPAVTALVELGLDAEGRTGSSPNGQHRLYAASTRLRYVAHQEATKPPGRVLRIVQRDPVTGVEVTSTLEHRDGATAVRAQTLLGHGVPLATSSSRTGLTPMAGVLRAAAIERRNVPEAGAWLRWEPK